MTALVLSILNGSLPFLQIRRTTIKAWMSLSSVKTPSPIMELAPPGASEKFMDSVVTPLAPSF